MKNFKTVSVVLNRVWDHPDCRALFVQVLPCGAGPQREAVVHTLGNTSSLGVQGLSHGSLALASSQGTKETPRERKISFLPFSILSVQTGDLESDVALKSVLGLP